MQANVATDTVLVSNVPHWRAPEECQTQIFILHCSSTRLFTLYWYRSQLLMKCAIIVNGTAIGYYYSNIMPFVYKTVRSVLFNYYI